jgi:type IV secretion system protein VirD4
MKLKFTAEPKDILYFVLFSVFLFYMIAVAIGNITSISSGLDPVWFNPLPGLSPENIFGTFIFFVIAIFAIISMVSSYFFDRETGFGISKEKKSKGGYSDWAKPKDIKESRGVKEVNESDENYESAGIPLYSENGKIWVDDGESHSLIIGATGSGKTYCMVNPLVNILAKKGESMIITDPKAEIYENNANYLRARGYNIILLNFRNPQRGNMWNPLSLPYKLYKAGNIDKSNELLRDIATNILHEEKTDDPFWQNTAADYFVGLAQGLFQDVEEKYININSIIQMLTVGEEKYGASTYAKEYFKLKDSSNSAYINAAGTVDAPSDTKGSIISVFRQKINIFAMAENLSEMLSESNFDLMDIGRKRTAVFMIIQDEKRTYHSLTTIFVKQCYESLIDVAQEAGGQLPVRTNFILDEFANMPELKDVTTMITAARSRQVRFNLIIQNFAQLNQVYGKENAETIKGNCGNMIYLLSSELSALEEISKLCGDKKIKSKGKDKPDETRPLISVTDLQKLKFKDAIIIKQRQSPFQVKLKGVDEYNWNIPKYEKPDYPTREKKAINLFDMKAFVKDHKKDAMADMFGPKPGSYSPPALGNNSPFGGLNNEVNKPFDYNKNLINNNAKKEEKYEVDDLIKKIDAKIAELEAEEQAEKSKIRGGSVDKKGLEVLENNNPVNENLNNVPVFNNNDLKKIIEPSPQDAVKVNENINKIIDKISDDDVSEDEFFDDFFSDE